MSSEIEKKVEAIKADIDEMANDMNEARNAQIEALDDIISHCETARNALQADADREERDERESDEDDTE